VIEARPGIIESTHIEPLKENTSRQYTTLVPTSSIIFTSLVFVQNEINGKMSEQLQVAQALPNQKW